MCYDILGTVTLVDFASRILASMVGGFVAAGLLWLYAWLGLRRKLKKLEGIYESVNPDRTPRDKTGSVTIAFQCRRLLAVKAQGNEGAWEGQIEVADPCSHVGHGTYRYTDRPGKDLNTTPEWGLHQIRILDENTIEIVGTCRSDPYSEPLYVILQRKTP